MSRILSGIQPSGVLHIGNYFGALKQWVELQKSNDCFFCIVDLHAITVPYDPKKLQERVISTALDYLAAGLDPKKSVIFVQSHVPEHTELMWLLNTITPFGELQRMTQWKEKVRISDNETIQLVTLGNKRIGEIIQDELKLAKKDGHSNLEIDKRINQRVENETLLPAIWYHMNRAAAGLLNYPILQTADILLYKANLIPIGEDQVQHVELARVIARKFNTTFGETFPEPQTKLTTAKRLMSLADPTRKMSKSDGEKSYLAITDEPETIKAKLAKAVTATKGGGDNPGARNLLTILRECDPKLADQYEKAEADGSIRYEDLKTDLAKALAGYFAPFREKRKELATKPKHTTDVLEDGAARARKIARTTMAEVREKMGLR